MQMTRVALIAAALLIAPGLSLAQDYPVGVLGPAGLPAAIVARLNAELNKALNSTETRTALENIGYEVSAGTAQDFATLMASDVKVYRKFAETIGIVAK